MQHRSLVVMGDEPIDGLEDLRPKATDAQPSNKQVSVHFPQETLARDRIDRFQIGPALELFHRAVPALRFLNWSIEEIERGFAVTRLPLNVESSNQYITQQAALMLLAADYTGGIALSTLFRDAPVIGFHPQRTHYGAYLWGAAAKIKWLLPQHRRPHLGIYNSGT